MFYIVKNNGRFTQAMVAKLSPILVFFPDKLEITTAVIVSVWCWLNFSPCIDLVLIFFHILDFLEHWVLRESIIPLKPVIGGMRVVALSISSHKKTQKKTILLFSYTVGFLYF